MLVLAMEFSRCAQRAMRTPDIKEQTDGWVRMGTGERPIRAIDGSVGVASEGGIAPGCPIGQDPRVAPSKRNSDARHRTQSPQARRTGHQRRCAVRQGRGGGDSE
jgi:hypothetical protein